MRLGKIGTLLVASIAFGALSSSAYALTLKVSDSHNNNHSTVVALKEFSSAIEERTGGDVKVQVFGAGVLGTESEMINQLRMGILDMVRTAPTDLEKFNPTYSAFLLPYLFKDDAGVEKAMNAVKEDVFHSHPDSGFMGLAWNTAGARSFYTVNKEINSPDDLAGLKIRVPNSRSMTRAVEMLGATATPVPWGEVYTALQQGIVDGAEGSPTSLIDGKFVEVIRHFSFDRHFTIPDVLIISSKTWEKLNDEQKAIFKDEAENYTKRVAALEEEKVAKAIEQSKKQGVTFKEVDLAPFKARVMPLYDELRANNKEAAEIVSRIEAAQE
nr:TRAP transporter substrate-binding protein [uncultured Cohaesibacter sp.]